MSLIGIEIQNKSKLKRCAFDQNTKLMSKKKIKDVPKAKQIFALLLPYILEEKTLYRDVIKRESCFTFLRCHVLKNTNVTRKI
jgi:hypothetical protein